MQQWSRELVFQFIYCLLFLWVKFALFNYLLIFNRESESLLYCHPADVTPPLHTREVGCKLWPERMRITPSVNKSFEDYCKSFQVRDAPHLQHCDICMPTLKNRFHVPSFFIVKNWAKFQWSTGQWKSELLKWRSSSSSILFAGESIFTGWIDRSRV